MADNTGVIRRNRAVCSVFKNVPEVCGVFIIHRFSARIELRFYLPVPIAGTVGQAKRVGHHHGISLQAQRIRLVVIKMRIGLYAPFTADLAVRARVREYRDAEILHRLLRRNVLPDGKRIFGHTAAAVGNAVILTLDDTVGRLVTGCALEPLHPREFHFTEYRLLVERRYLRHDDQRCQGPVGAVFPQLLVIRLHGTARQYYYLSLKGKGGNVNTAPLLVTL